MCYMCLFVCCRVLSIALAPVPGVLPFVATCRRSIALCLLLGCRSRLRQSSEIVNMSYCPSICPLVLLFVNMSYCSSICPLVLLFVNIACLSYSFCLFFSFHPTWYMWVHVFHFFFQIYVCYVLYVILYK